MGSKTSSSPGLALVLIDVINDMDFPEGGQLLRHALLAARVVAKLMQRVKRAGWPVIYVNDNFGRWQSDFRHQVEYCLSPETPGREVAFLLKPEEDDYFVLKPKHSGFYSTTLDVLLEDLGVGTLILAGFATNICVLFTANDAYMRDYRLIIPRDGVAAETAEVNEYALTQMRDYLRADVRNSRNIRLPVARGQGKG